MNERAAKAHIFTGLLVGLGGVLLYGGLRTVLFGPLTLQQWLAPFIFVFISAGLAVLGRPVISGDRFVFQRGTLTLILLLFISLLLHLEYRRTLTAWAIVLLFNGAAGGLYVATREKALNARQFLKGLGLAVVAALLPILVEQAEDGFAREEFFVLLDFVLLLLPGAALSLLLWFWGRLGRQNPGRWSMPIRGLGAAILLAGVVLSVGFVRAYQTSFYPLQGTELPEGITAETPFICESLPAQEAALSGKNLTARLVELIENKSVKSTKDLAFLFLASGDSEWGSAYRTAFMQEVRERRYTQPANSVKYDQYLAAQRIYFYLQVVEAQPDFFSAAETGEILGWVRAVNERALQIGWVDLLYALSFSKLPDGPYENQENGLGLLALIEANGLSMEDLSARNRAYLEKHRSGWTARFRNSDDAVNYQGEWIENAWHQAVWDPEIDPEKERLSFEWLLLQMPPSGAPLRYNHLASFTMADLGNLAYARTGDPVYIWLAERAAAYLAAEGSAIGTRPGMELFTSMEGLPPQTGSCVLYGDSGLPNQAGPLLPDKIVLRDGWEPDDTYLLLNLRFTGWHRYKATNSIVSIIKGDAVIQEDTRGAMYRWLPQGRSLLRDKRIPRESLNGLLVPVSGMDGVLYHLVGSGSRWAQNPPQTADVLDVRLGNAQDTVVTQIRDWNGWQHQRAVILYRDGPLIVADEVKSRDPRPSAIAWHLAGDVEMLPDRYRITAGNQTVEIVPVRIGMEALQERMDVETGTLMFEQAGDFRVITVFLFGDDLGAEVMLDLSGTRLSIQSSESYSIDLPEWR